MAIEMRAEIVGMTKEQYDDGISQVGAKLKATPGFIAHIAGPMAGGYRVTELWESREALDRWIREEIMPMAEQIGIPPFQPQILPADNLITR
jgi:hypothetical protein